MAVGGLEVEIVTGGINEQPADRGRWVQNMWKRRGHDAWETRPGFGQLAAYNTSMDAPVDVSKYGNEFWGYHKHLGSTSVITAWGAVHLVSVFWARNQTGQSSGSLNSVWSDCYVVSIVDASNGTRWETILHHHTSELKGSKLPQLHWRGCYETNEDIDNQNFVGAMEERFYFHRYGEKLFFGNSSTGLLVYQPVDFRSNRRKTVDSDEKKDWVNGYSESNIITRVVPVDGLFPLAYNYLTKEELPPPVDLTTVQDRLVIATETEIFFSEPGVPNAFISTNVVVVPSQQNVTAVGVVDDNLMVFTKSETFLYQPSVGDLASQGRFITVSNTVGCLSPTAKVEKVPGTAGMFWCDSNGVYVTSNGLSISTVSDPIHEFFDKGLTSPLNHYLTANGVADVSTDVQPRTLLRFNDDDLVSLDFWAEEGQLVLCSPTNLAAFVFSEGNWSVWSLESCASQNAGGTAIVKAQQNIQNPYLVVGGDGLYCVGSVDYEGFADAQTGESSTAYSYYLLEMGRGGGLDRSMQYEDYRSVSNYYQIINQASAKNGRFYFADPVYDATTGYYFQAVEVYFSSAYFALVPHDFELDFTFDAVNWQLDTDPGVPADLFPDYPLERIASSALYVSKTVNNAAGSVSLRLTTPAGTPPRMTPDHRNPFFILRWRKATTNTSLSFGVGVTVARLTDNSPQTLDCGVYVWNSHNGPLDSVNEKAQAVDWAYKSAQVGETNNGQVKARGLWTRMISHSSATNQIVPNWVWGLFNILGASDWKGWTSQIVDFTAHTPAIESTANKNTIRTRYKDTTTGAMATRTFNGSPKYSDYLIDDEEYDTLAVSDSIRGEYFSYMLFGFIRDRAEKLVLGGSKALIRPNQGSRRRTGR